MHTMVGPEGQKMLKFYILYTAGKCIFQGKLRHLVKATLQSDFTMKIVFRMGKT